MPRLWTSWRSAVSVTCCSARVAPGEDLISRDIWRADDHGIGTYNQVLAAFGLPTVTNTTITLTDPTDSTTFISHGFEQITSDLHIARLLSDAYTGPTRGTFLLNGKFAGDINPFIAGLAEDHVPGSDLGPLFHTILVNQFSRLRDGDQYFYLNEVFNAEEQGFINQANTLGKIITANTGVTNLQADVFRYLSVENGVGKGYYTSKNGQAALTGTTSGTIILAPIYNALVAKLANPNLPGYLVLVDANGNYETTAWLQSYANVKSYLLNASSTNMAYMLSAQLLTAELNVQLGRVNATTSIFVPAVTLVGTNQYLSKGLKQSLQNNDVFSTVTHPVSDPSGIALIQDILDAAIAELANAPITTAAGADRTFEEALKDCLDAINNNEVIFIL